MLNKQEIKDRMEVLKTLYKIALRTNDTKKMDDIVSEIMRINLMLKEESVKNRYGDSIKNLFSSEIDFCMEQEEVIRQSSIEESFCNKLKEVYTKYKNSSNRNASEKQINAIMSSIRDRIGMDITKEQITFLNRLNSKQASELIRILSSISFYDQRVMITGVLNLLKDREDYPEIFAEVYNNIYKREWFEFNKDLLNMSYELQEPTDIQVSKIANISKYIETQQCLISDYGIDVRDFEYRKDNNLYYSFNWVALKKEIKVKFNRESAYNFLQTYEYITNFYEGNKLDNDQMNHLRTLYIQLGDYECTRLTYLMSITKQHYDVIARNLENRVRLNKIANNEATNRFRESVEFIKPSARSSRNRKSFELKTEERYAKELSAFIFDIYSCVGQEVPDDMHEIIPYFIDRGQIIYSSVEERHYKEFRKMVFEQREIIKELNTDFNWATFIANQPTHVLQVLGLDMMM